MINLNTNSVNQIFTTFTEMSLITDALYIAEIENNQTNEIKYMRFDDNLSPNRFRWDIFDVELVANVGLEDLENAKIYLTPGTYDYNVYETSGTTGTSIAGLNRVESGLMTVSGTTASPTYYSSSTSNNYTIYGQ